MYACTVCVCVGQVWLEQVVQGPTADVHALSQASCRAYENPQPHLQERGSWENEEVDQLQAKSQLLPVSAQTQW